MKLENINGSLCEALIQGATIIKVLDDGYDFHVLVKNPKGSEWKYCLHSTITFLEGALSKGHMFLKGTEYNMMEKSAVRELHKEARDARYHISVINKQHKTTQ